MKYFKKFCCWVGWHSIFVGFASINQHPDDLSIRWPLCFLVFAKCKWCGYEGQIDSKGNLF